MAHSTQLNHRSLSTGLEKSDAAAFFRDVLEAFQRAVAKSTGGVMDRFYRIGGYLVRLRFAGPALIPFLTPALEHLAAQPEEEAALTVCLWDSVSTGENMPTPPWSWDSHLLRGEVRGFNDGRICTAHQLGAGALSILDNGPGLALYWVRDAQAIPYFESGAPLRAILHWFMEKRERQCIHGAAVGTAEGAALLAGKGGSGKSTAALACLSAGLHYVGDDFVLLRKDPAPFVYSLYNTAKIDSADVRKFPHLLPHVRNVERLDTEKALLFLHEAHREKIVPGLPARAVLIPRVTQRPETTLTKASPAASLRALAPSTIFLLPGAGGEAFRYLSDFVKRVPSYYLDLGTDLPRIPDAILEALSEL